MESIEGSPFVRFVLDVQRRYGQDQAGQMAAAVAYYGFLSLFPLLLLGVSVAGFVLASDPAAQASLASRITEVVPGLGPLIGRNLDAVVRARTGAGIAGLAGLLWSGTGATEAVGAAMARINRRVRTSTFLRTKAWSISSTLALGTLAVAIADPPGGPLVATGLRVGAFAATLGLDVLLFAVAYRILTPGDGPRFGDVWPGAAFAAAGWTLLKLGGAWYAARTVRSASEVFGAFASVVGVLVLLYLAARLLMYGAEINAVLCERLGGDGMSVSDPRTNGNAASPGASTPQLVQSIATDLGTLVRKEVELAKQEVVEAVTAKLRAAASAAAAGVMALFAIVFAGAAAAAALDAVFAPWASRLVVAGAFALAAAGAGMFALARMKRPSIAPDQTVKTVKEDVEWAKAQLRR